EACGAVFKDFRNCPVRICNYRSSLAKDSIITNPNGSGQSIGNRRAKALPKNSPFSLSVISPYAFDQGISQQRLYFTDEIFLIGRIHFRRHFESVGLVAHQEESRGALLALIKE